MATFRYELDSKPNKNGVHSIYLCVSVNGKRKRKKTPFTVNNPSEFNAKCKGDKWIRSSVLESKVLNNQMRDLLQSTRGKYIKRHKETDVVTSEDVVIDLCKKEKTESFLAFAIKRTQELHDEGSLRNWKKYNGFCNKLKVYLKLKHKRDLFVHEVTPVFLSDFYSYLRKLPNSNNPTKVIHINTVAVVFNSCQKSNYIGYYKAGKRSFSSLQVFYGEN
ncbi:MAG: phage integrase SAM-like domain and Arm DNA-binding domain-containing protein [Bacteroidaceae bacterium]|nr:phage integrase SAM-like domain and Arm DNA-binding domain-containing protein [Bacteroidaceae bacterium]